MTDFIKWCALSLIAGFSCAAFWYLAYPEYKSDHINTEQTIELMDKRTFPLGGDKDES